jgi:hypothetical protein
MKPSHEIYCKAIRELRRIAFEYDGLERVVEPYCFGLSTQRNEVLRAVQVGGASRSNSLGIGKLWKVARIRNPRLLEEKFAPDDPDYNPDDKGMLEIHCRVERR